MTGAERGFLLLSSCLGDPSRKPLTTAQMRVLAERSWQLEVNDPDRDLAADDLTKLGYGKDMAQRIVALLSQEDVLEHYLSRGKPPPARAESLVKKVSTPPITARQMPQITGNNLICFIGTPPLDKGIIAQTGNTKRTRM